MTMTPDDLRALADALEPMAQAPRFEGFDVPAFCAWVRACADAEPVARIYTDAEMVHRDERWGRVQWIEPESELAEGTLLYTRPAPAAPQAEPSAALIRAYNSGYMQGHHDTVEAQFIVIHPLDMDTYHADVVAELGLTAAPQAEPCIGNDSACPCQDGDACHYKDAADGTKAWPVPQAEPKRDPTCLWSRADDDTDVWETSCGHAFTIIDGTPGDNHMEFCCYCGRPLEQEIGGSDAE